MHPSSTWRPNAPLPPAVFPNMPPNFNAPLSPGGMQQTPLDAQQEAEWESDGGSLARFPAQSPSTAAADGYWMTGTILSLRARGFGFIAAASYARPWALRFRSNAVTHNRFDQLQVGGRLRFHRVRLPEDPSRARAVHVASIV